MTDLYSDCDIVAVLREQLPRMLKKLKINVTNEPRIAIFTYNGRSVEFPVREDGSITEVALAHLCVFF
jgi:hypothetical protein